MNQILQVQETRKNSNPVDTKKIVLFFAVCLIIFGIILLGQGAYSVYKNKQNEKVQPSTPPGGGSVLEPEYIAPTITMTKIEDNKFFIATSKGLIAPTVLQFGNFFMGDAADFIRIVNPKIGEEFK